MLLEASTLAGKIGAILATVLYALTLLGQVERVVIEHLGETFASKQDVQVIKDNVAVIDRKVDTVLEHVKHERR